MSINKLFTKQKNDRFAVWRIVYLLVGGLMAAGTIITSYFVYQNIYAAFSNTQAIGILQASASVDTLNLKDYDNIQTVLDKKNNAKPIPDQIRNIFIPASTSTVAVTTSTNASTTTPKNKK